MSASGFLKLSAIVAFFVVGGVMGAKLTTCGSSGCVIHLIAFDGSVIRFCTVLFACFVLPCTVANVITIAEAPGCDVGV